MNMNVGSGEGKTNNMQAQEYKLIIVSSDVHEVFLIPEGTTGLGRDSSNEIQLLSNGVSRFHAKFINDKDGIKVFDLNSANGVFVNGKRVSESRTLNRGDELRIGHCTFRLWDAAYDGPDEVVMSPDGFAEYSEAKTVRVEMHPDDPRRSDS